MGQSRTFRPLKVQDKARGVIQSKKVVKIRELDLLLLKTMKDKKLSVDN